MATATKLPTLHINGCWIQFQPYLATLTPFNTGGAMHARSGSLWSTGKLPAEYRASACQSDYAVYSYRTPIAWHLPSGQWVMPAVRYSVTTTKQAGRIATALSQLTSEVQS